MTKQQTTDTLTEDAPAHDGAAVDVAALRQRLGLSRKELAQAVGLKASTTVCRWENGTSEPRGSALILLRQLLHQADMAEAARS